jgi:hypothetical protein
MEPVCCSAVRQPHEACRGVYSRLCIAPSIGKRDRIMSALIGILITFLVVILVLYLVNMLPIEGRAKHIVRIIVIIIGILSLLKYLSVF